MGRFDPKYSDDQRAAIRKAVIDDRSSCPKAIKAASEGRLYGLEPFDMPLSTARDLVAKERKRRRGEDHQQRAQGTPEQRIDAELDRLIAIASHNIGRVDNRASRRDLNPDEQRLLTSMGKLLRETKGLAKGIPLTASGKENHRQAAKADDNGKQQPHRSALVTKLLQGDRKGRNAAPQPTATATTTATGNGNDRSS